MARVAINTGSVPNDGTGDSLRIAGGIINDNFSEIYNQFGDGSDLTPTWDKSAAGINTTSSVGIGTTNPRFTLEVGSVGASGTSLYVHGNARVTGILTVGSSSIVLDGDSNKILVGSGISFDGNTGIISATAFYAGGSIVSGSGGGGLNYWESGATGITTTSNVGVATNSAPSALTVGGNSLFTGIATFRNNVTLANLTSSSNTLRFGSNSYIDQSNSDIFTFQINSGADGSGSDSSFVFRTTEPGVSPIPDQAYDTFRVYSRGDYWNGLVRSYTDFHADQNAFVGGDLQVGAASTLIGVGSTLGSFKVGAGGTVITTTSAGLVGIGTSVPNSKLHVVGVSTFNGDVYIDDKLYVNGIEITTSGGGGVSIGEDIVTRNLKATGITTLGVTSTTNLTAQQLSVSGVSTFSGDGNNSYQYFTSPNAYLDFASTFNVKKNGTTYINVSENTVALSENTTLNAAYWRVRTLSTGAEVNGTLESQQLSVSGVSTLSSDVSIGGTVSVDGSIKLTGINTSLVGTSGTSGDIKTIGGYPFYHDGTAWREFVLSSGTPVSVPVDTEWNNVVFRATFDNDFTDAKFEATPVYVGAGATIVGAAVTIGTGAYANMGGSVIGVGVSYPYRSEYDFTGSWTIEYWGYHDSDVPFGSYISLVSQYANNDTTGNWAFGMYRYSSGVHWMWANENGSNPFIETIDEATWAANYLNKWNHYALVREGDNGSLHFYVNGVESAKTINNAIIDNNILHFNGSGLGFGAAFGNQAPTVNGIFFNSGYSADVIFDDVRISAGVGTAGQRYTSIGSSTSAAFTPPTTALPTTGTLPSIVNPSISAGPVSASSLNVTGISTLGTVKVSSGIVTATSGIVAYYGDVSNAADGRWTLGANGLTDYTFTGIGFTQTTNDPVLYLARGRVYEFVNDSGGSHPFEIRVGNGGAAYDDGVTDNGAATGTIRFEVPFNAPNTLYYQCTNHSGMGNTISVYPNTI